MKSKRIVGLAAFLLTAWLQSPSVQAAGPIPNQLARTRGCRDDGPFGVNRLLPSWVSVEPGDAPQIAEGIVRASHVSRVDMPAYHTSHDWNFDVELDPAYVGLYSDADIGQDDDDEGEARDQMEMEWEINYFPPRFWPMTGDRVWMMGRWIFDCGHPPYRTELHPAKSVAFTRLEPTIFKGDQKPSLTYRTYVYLHGLGGYYQAPIANRNYEFDITLPARPSAQAELHAEVLETPLGGPKPILKALTGQNKVHVLYPLDLKDANPAREFGAVIATGWREPVLTKAYRTLRLSIDSITINQTHDPKGAGEWRLYLRAGSQWIGIPGLDPVYQGDVRAIKHSQLITVPETGSLSLQSTGWESDCDTVFRNHHSEIQQRLNINDLPPESLKCQADENDYLGHFEKRYTQADNFGIGSHRENSTRNNGNDTIGDYTLSYRIEEVKRFEVGQK